MSGIRIGLLISVSERYVLALVALASSMLVARLLTPEEIGIYSVSVAVIAIAQVLRDFGIGSFIVQAREVTEDILRTAFGLSLLVGTGLFAAVYLLAPLASRFYAEPALVETLYISSLNFLILPFCSISMSLLRREMRFKAIATINVVAAVLGAAAVVLSAVLGAGPNSMAIGSVVASLATGMGTWIAREDRKFLFPALTEWRTLIKYSSQATAASAVTSLAVSSNDLVLGKVLGFGPVAIISRAQGLMNMFHRDMMMAVRNVAFPAFAKAHRDGLDLESKYISSVTAITAFAWPFYATLAVFPLEIIRLLFGDQWDAAVPMVPVFALAGAISATVSLALPLLTASGRIDLTTRAELTVQPLRFGLIAGAAIIFGNTMACALAYLLITALALPVFYRYKGMAIANDFKRLFAGLGKSFMITATTMAIPLAISIMGGVDRSAPLPWVHFGLAVVATVIVWPLALHALQHPISRDEAFIKIRRKVLRQAL